MVLVSINTSTFWKDESNRYIGCIPMAGVQVSTVQQNGRVLTINGDNPLLQVSYRYEVNLPIDSTDTPISRMEHGLLIIECPKVSTIQRVL